MKFVLLLVGSLVIATVFSIVESKKSSGKKLKSNRKATDETLKKTERYRVSLDGIETVSEQKKKRGRSRKKNSVESDEPKFSSDDLGFVFTWHQSPVHLRSKDYRYYLVAEFCKNNFKTHHMNIIYCATTEYETLNRWGSDHIGHGNEFKVALLGLRDAHPEIPIYLFTNIKIIPRDIKKLITHVHVIDLLEEGGINEIILQTGDVKFGFACKAQALISGWKRGLLPDRVIHFDVDIAIVSTYPSFNMYNVFQPLQVCIFHIFCYTYFCYLRFANYSSIELCALVVIYYVCCSSMILLV